jgi:hypothetical protein
LQQAMTISNKPSQNSESALHEHAQELRKTLIEQLGGRRDRRSPGGRRMMATQSGRDNTERLRELAARIATEQDHNKFTVLVKEFSELV